MPRRKKRFPCGHSGLGAFCRPCAELASKQKQKQDERANAVAARSAIEAQWRVLFPDQDRDFDTFPEPVTRKAVEIGAGLLRGAPVSRYRGRRFLFDHDRLRFGLPLHYRLVAREQAGSVTDMKVMSHETCNSFFPGSG